MRLKIAYYFLFIIFVTPILLKAQPKIGEAGSKGSYKAQGYNTLLSDSQNIKVQHYELWYEEVKIMSGNYSQGKKEGLWRQTNLTGDIFFQGYYVQDKKNGAWKYFFNKKPLCTIFYKDDKKDSIWQSFYENGQMQCSIKYSNGLRNGMFKLFYDNGNLNTEAIYKNDIIVGNYITYYKDNSIRTNIEYNNGGLSIIAMNDSLGRPVDFGNIKNGTGLLKRYRTDGNIASEENYLNSLKNGLSIIYFPSGKIYIEENYENGLRNGSSITYFDSGQINIKGEYKNNEPFGKWTYYNTSGEIFFTKNYNDKVTTFDSLKEVVESKSIDALEMPERMPSAQGGEMGLLTFVQKNITYPRQSKERGISGTVYITFVVTGTGNIRDIKILRGVNQELNYEAANVVNLMPPWTPGFQNGFPVDVHYNLPIKFVLR